jgi:hypothetical protein
MCLYGGGWHWCGLRDVEKVTIAFVSIGLELGGLESALIVKIMADINTGKIRKTSE